MSGQGDNSSVGNDQTFVQLEAESEWRFELESDENIAVRVQSPDPVYINSEELPPVTWYPLHRYLKASIYSPTPAKLEVSTLPVSQYSSGSTTQPALISLHLALERLRILARRATSTNGHGAPPASHSAPGSSRGPRVMVVGPPCSGKTTVVKNLANLALGSGLGWTPGIIGLDPSSPANLIPGSLSLSTPNHPIPTHHVAHPLGSPPTSVPANTLAGDVPTVGWWYGHPEPTTKGVDVWKKLVDAMAYRWKERCEKDPLTHASGAFIDTSSAFANPMLGTRKDDPKARYSLVAHAIAAFDVDTILVLGHEKLSIDLTRIFPSVQIIRVPKSGGVVDLDESYRQIVAAQQVRSYFYGEPELPREISTLSGRMVGLEGGLSPYSFQLGWETLTILRVGEGESAGIRLISQPQNRNRANRGQRLTAENAAPSTALPLGSSRILSPTRLTRVDPSGPAHITRLLNTVLAVVHLVPGDRIRKAPKEVRDAKVEAETAEVQADPKEDVKMDVAAGGDDHAGAPADVKVEGEGGEDDGEGDVDDDADEDEVPYVEEIGWREVTGFIVIAHDSTAIDTLRKKYTVLSPSPGKLPSTVAIAGSIEWVDSA